MIFRKWMLLAAPAIFAGALAITALIFTNAFAFARQQNDSVMIDWLGSVYRIGGPCKIKISTRNEKLSTTIHGSNLIFKCSDGREIKLASSAQETKPKMDSGMWFIEVEAGELSEVPAPGKFEVRYKIPDGHLVGPLIGTFVKKIDNPLEQLEKTPKPGDYSKVAVLLETSEGPILIGLRPDKAPATVANFVKLTHRSFYDEKIFHRVKRGFVLQGGGYKKDGTKAESEKIKGEFSDFSHARGVLSMARLGNDKDSATCQFFICLTDQKQTLDGQYAAFAKVLEGMDTLDRIAVLPVKFNPDLRETSSPLKPIIINKAFCVERPQ
ncbi:MAG: peptidylprolyl isomerase [Planctomycetota bacterium]